MQILPSGQPHASGLTLTPFRGLRYAQGRVSGLAEVTSPPYDVIASDAADQLFAADPHNVVRLILPRHEACNPGDAYQDAARLLREWQDQGVLVPDPLPAIYVYEQRLPTGEPLQRGLIGALRLVPLDAGPVLPHEDVMPGPVAGRRQLMEATQANLEPIFLLYDGEAGGDATTITMAVADQRPPLLAIDTSDGVTHRLWAITDPAEQARITADLASRRALIADGHHRYAAYLQVSERSRAAGRGAGPWDAGLALLVDSAAFPPRIGAIHRVISGLAPADAAQRAKAAFTVRQIAATGPADALAALAACEPVQSAFLVAGGGDYHLLTDPDPAEVTAAMPARSARWRALPASVMQELLLARLWNVRDGEDTVRVHHDAGAALREVADGAGTAVICPPVSAADVHEVAAHGERLPRKSTSFAPKPRTGLVMRSFAL